jgi:hypothetical protein
LSQDLELPNTLENFNYLVISFSKISELRLLPQSLSQILDNSLINIAIKRLRHRAQNAPLCPIKSVCFLIAMTNEVKMRFRVKTSSFNQEWMI